MPHEPHGSGNGVDLLELRVLDGPNRFFARPAIKLEFSAERPGDAAEAAASAGLAVRRLHVALGLAAPAITSRRSADDLRALVAFPWRRRTISPAIGAAAVRLALGRGDEQRELAALRATALGPLPRLPSSHIPIVAVTGTNGKSTTTRLIAHVARGIGLSVGMTNSDGIELNGKQVEAGDWSGFGGAGRVLSEPGLQLAVLETARGGILLRGIGYATNDVGVVTNISADHLGLQGIDTLDELAEVKATVVRITRKSGWAVLNGDDPLVWAMRRETPAHWYAFSFDPAAPAVEAALEAGGRAAVLDRGWLVLRRSDAPPARVARAEELPLTLGGLSRHNVANALAATAACDGLGFETAAIADGLRTFGADAARNPGRLNLFARDGIRVLIDFAHNEAGLRGLLDVARGIAGSGGRVLLALGTAGDRSDAVLRSLGEIAGAGADEIVIAEKPHYLRGRDLGQMNELLRDGVSAGGYAGDVDACPSEVSALSELVGRAAGRDVVAVMVHAERSDVFEWLAREGFEAVQPASLV
jgi:cyanophycin synthetase